MAMKKNPISTPVKSPFAVGDINKAATAAQRGSEPGYPKGNQSSSIPSPVIRQNPKK
jgi:hypothetical protein